MSYVEVPSEQLFSFLEEKGFSKTERYSEVVYERRHHLDSRYKVLVYTSVGVGRKKARGRGLDAIRVCAIFEDGDRSRGVAKLPRIHRTGTVEGILERVLKRARDAYKITNERLKRLKAYGETD